MAGDAPYVDALGHLILRGERRWLVNGPPSELDTLCTLLEGLIERLGEDIVELWFDNAVGLFDLGHLGTIEVRSGKWSQADFDGMLTAITERAAALPFAAGSSGALPYMLSSLINDVDYHAFVYLRHIILGQDPSETRLEPAMEAIFHDPHRRGTKVTRRVPAEQAQHVGPRAISQLAGSATLLQSCDRSDLALARLLKGHWPEAVDESHTIVTFDTPENRFVCAFLDLADRVISQFSQMLEGSNATGERGIRPAFRRRLQNEAMKMATFIEDQRRRTRVWGELAPMVHLPASSTVLQRRRGYRDVFTHYVRLHLATRLPLSQNAIWRLLELKDLATLYELWSFFEVVAAVQAKLGPPMAADLVRPNPWQQQVLHSTEVRWDEVSVWYNLTFSPSSRAGYHSYSVPLRPDIALRVRDGPNAGLHLLDAKFRLDRAADIFTGPATDVDEERQLSEQRRGTFKRDDLYKMHTYRDAISECRSVWILYPGDEERFCHADTSDGTGLDGVGAIPLLPGGVHVEALARRVGELLGVGGDV